MPAVCSTSRGSTTSCSPASATSASASKGSRAAARRKPRSERWLRVDYPVELAPNRKGGLPLRNPVLTASGTFGYGIEFANLLDLEQLGGIVTKSVSWRPPAGKHPPPSMQ